MNNKKSGVPWTVLMLVGLGLFSSIGLWSVLVLVVVALGVLVFRHSVGQASQKTPAQRVPHPFVPAQQRGRAVMVVDDPVVEYAHQQEGLSDLLAAGIIDRAEYNERLATLREEEHI